MSEFQPAAFQRFGAVAVRLSVELGRTEMPLRDVLMLGEGSTVMLDRLTDELLDVMKRLWSSTENVDHDGRSDVAVAASSGVITVAGGDGTGGWTFVDTYNRGGTPWQVVFAQFNGDEDLDMLVSDSSSDRVFVWFGEGNGSFVSGGTVFTSMGPRGMHVADVNDDGQDDLLVAGDADDTVSVHLSDGFGDVSTT